MNNTLTNDELFNEIRETNLSYLMLAQQMVKQDKDAAIYRLGVNVDIANLIEGLSNSQLIRLASNHMMLAKFRFDDSAILSMLTDYNKGAFQSMSHSAILMASQPAETLA